MRAFAEISHECEKVFGRKYFNSSNKKKRKAFNLSLHKAAIQFQTLLLNHLEEAILSPLLASLLRIETKLFPIVVEHTEFMCAFMCVCVCV